MLRNKLNGIIAASLLIVLLLSGCSSSTVSTNNENKKAVTISASFYPVYIFLLNITRDIPDIRVNNLTNQAVGCLHDYSLTTENMKNLEKTDIFVINGAAMESFMNKVIKAQPSLKIVDSSEGIKILKDSGGNDNPHLWVSITNAIIQVKNIGSKLSGLIPDSAEAIRKNTESYVNRLNELKQKMHNELDKYKNSDIITFHEAFPYFAKEFNLNIVSVIEREPGTEPNARELLDTIALIKKLKVKAIFVEPQYSSKASRTIANETGIKVFTLDPVVTGPDSRDAYINIMEDNLKTLQEAFK